MGQLITPMTAERLFKKEQELNISVSDYIKYEKYYCAEYANGIIEPDYAVDTCIERNDYTMHPAYSQTDLQAYLREHFRIVVEANFHYIDREITYLFKVHVQNYEKLCIEQTGEYIQSYEEALELGLKQGILYMKLL